MPERWEAVMGGLALKREQYSIAARELLNKSGNRRIWLLYGEMGAGKTTLIKELCHSLGVSSGMSSPTFSIVNEYITVGSEQIFHFDFYRLKNATEAFDIGVEEYLDSGSYCFIEWPEKAEQVIPKDTFMVRIREVDASSRLIEFAL